MADAFVTGHKPKETLEQLISRLNANSPISKDVPVTGQEKTKARRTKVQRLMDRLEGYTPAQRKLLLELLLGHRSLLRSEHGTFAVRRVKDGFRVCGLHTEATDHLVTEGENAGCTCEDFKFRNRKCCHMLALEGMGT